MSGPLGDTHGRRFTVIFAHSLVTVLGVASAMADSVALLLACRFGIGVGCGAGIPALVTLLVEMSPTSARSHLNNIQGGLFFPLGEIWASLSLVIFMPTMLENEWRKMILWANLPAILALPFALIILRESPRWLLKKGRDEELEQTVNYIATLNGKSDCVAGLK
eukprot:gnl/MRDRNA2_/MRDRNA2_293975_c0_seq1.p1 gnl/MRDRNA2_/MRDRNA2_293975_c0~~gnl/MRDRNA2_/MRDRNA2_293975_c0_seq1.p1  ORF type:complete len:164 (-),score=19.84 gnl/MRDRNA2_/MRDRNA2_293975_c0_seq1:239-730(-)